MEVAKERAVWVSLLNLLLLRPRRAEEDEDKNTLLENKNLSGNGIC